MAGNTVRLRATLDDNVSSGLDKIRDKFDRLGTNKGAQALLQGVGVGAGITAIGLLGTAADKAGQFLAESVTAASDLNETISKSNVIFGSSAGEVQAWADTMDDAGGQSKKAALDAASGFAGLFKGVGIGIDETTDMSEGLTQLGSDLASFFNTDVETALDSLKSGLNGEAEPLRKFNVFLSDSAIKAKAMQMGLQPVNGQLTEGQKIMARYQIILDQTTDAQGDFARTSDGLANSSRQLDAKINNLQARIGGVLVPVMEHATDVALDLADGLDVMTDSSTSLEDKLKAASDATQIFRDILSPGNVVIRDYIDKSKEAAKTTEALGVKFGITGSDAKRLRGQIDATGDETAGTTKQVDKLKEALDDLHQPFSTAELDAGDLEDALAGAKDELKGNIKHLHELEKIKNPTREQRADIRETRSAIRDNKREVIENSLKLSAMGKIGFRQLNRNLDGVGVNLDQVHDAAILARKAIDSMNTAAARARTGANFEIGGHAEGGWVGLNGPELSWLGERGPEYVVKNEDLGKLSRSQPSTAGVTLVGVSERQIMDMVERNMFFRLQRAPKV